MTIDNNRIFSITQQTYESEFNEFNLYKNKFNQNIMRIFWLVCFVSIILFIIFNFFDHPIYDILWIVGISIFILGIILCIFLSFINVTIINEKAKSKWQANAQINYAKIIDAASGIKVTFSEEFIKYKIDDKIYVFNKLDKQLILNNKVLSESCQLYNFDKKWKYQQIAKKRSAFHYSLINHCKNAMADMIIDDLRAINGNYEKNS